MAFNSQEIIQDVRTEFEHLLDFVTGEHARTAMADNIERGLFKMLLCLGAKLLQLFFTKRAQLSLYGQPASNMKPKPSILSPLSKH